MYKKGVRKGPFFIYKPNGKVYKGEYDTNGIIHEEELIEPPSKTFENNLIIIKPQEKIDMLSPARVNTWYTKSPLLWGYEWSHEKKKNSVNGEASTIQ